MEMFNLRTIVNETRGATWSAESLLRQLFIRGTENV